MMIDKKRIASLAYGDEFKMTLTGWKRFQRSGTALLAGAALLTLAGCQQFADIPKHLRPLDSNTKLLLEKKGMMPESPILVRIFKQESELEVWKKQKQTGKFALLKTYEICKWSGELGPKFKEGDRQAPEGFYTIRPTQMNPKSSYYLSFNLGYPNAFDKAHGRTGTHLMVHGACSSRGCYSMDDDQIQDIYSLGRLAFQGGQRAFQVQAYPFRMTPANLAANSKSPHYEFWQMLKEGNDHFLVTGQPPKIDVCSKRYVFNAVAEDGARFDPTAQCPQMSIPEPIRLAVEKRQNRDRSKTEQLIARLEARQNGQGPLNGLFGASAVAGSQKTPQPAAPSQTASHGAAQPVLQSTPTGLAAAGEVAKPAARPEPEDSVANAYVSEQDNRSGGFISGLMKRIW